jgi:DNA-directed RNA polymerase specialized sigma24 family protein
MAGQRESVLARAERAYPRIPRADLEDLLADAELALLARGGIADAGHLGGATWTGLEFRAGHWFRRSARAGTLDEQQLAELADPGGAIEDEALDRDERRLLADLLADLTPAEADVIKLRAGEELSRGRAARTLGIAVPELRRLERSGWSKISATALVARAGRLCAKRKVAIAAFAEGTSDEQLAEAARRHLAHCAACRREFAAERERTRRRIAALLPLPLLAGAKHDLLGLLGLGGARAGAKASAPLRAGLSSAAQVASVGALVVGGGVAAIAVSKGGHAARSVPAIFQPGRGAAPPAAHARAAHAPRRHRVHRAAGHRALLTARSVAPAAAATTVPSSAGGATGPARSQPPAGPRPHAGPPASSPSPPPPPAAP